MYKFFCPFTLLIASLFIFISCDKDTPDQEPDVNHSFSEILMLIESAEDQNAVVDSFLDTLSSSPIIEGNTVYFIRKTSATKVEIAGDMNGWSPGSSFTRAGESNLFYLAKEYPLATRIEYKFVESSGGNGNWILDPLNPNKYVGGISTNSVLIMSEYQDGEEIIEQSGIGKGSLEQFSVPSQFITQDFTIWVYTPANYNTNDSYPVAYFQDGRDYIDHGRCQTILDNSIDDNSVASMIAVFVQPHDRAAEYATNQRQAYQNFFVQELVPYMDENYATDTVKTSRVVIGDSYGGNISALIAFNHQEVFGNCGLHSGAFQPNSYEAEFLIKSDTERSMRVASIWGAYESSLTGNMREMQDYLEGNGYDALIMEYPEGHSWGFWRIKTDDMLEFFFPGE